MLGISALCSIGPSCRGVNALLRAGAAPVVLRILTTARDPAKALMTHARADPVRCEDAVCKESSTGQEPKSSPPQSPAAVTHGLARGHERGQIMVGAGAHVSPGAGAGAGAGAGVEVAADEVAAGMGQEGGQGVESLTELGFLWQQLREQAFECVGGMAAAASLRPAELGPFFSWDEAMPIVVNALRQHEGVGDAAKLPRLGHGRWRSSVLKHLFKHRGQGGR